MHMSDGMFSHVVVQMVYSTERYHVFPKYSDIVCRDVAYVFQQTGLSKQCRP